MPLRFLIADDHEVVRIAVRILIAQTDDWQVCGEAANGIEAVLKASQLAPDVLILDLSMPGMNGFEVAEEVRRRAPSTKIVFFTMHEVPVTAREVGADAFVAKTDPAQNLITTIDRVISESRPSASVRGVGGRHAG